MKKCTLNSRRGFTLIELLVVIAIIAILLSILMPALSKVKEQARLIVCRSNLGQAGKSVYAYACEFDGFLPPMMQGDEIGTSVGCHVEEQGFGLLVAEPFGWSASGYLPDAESLICPTHKDGYVLQGWTMEREKRHFFRPEGSTEIKGKYMSYTYVYATPHDKHPDRAEWLKIPRYRIEKTEGKAVILFERGYWGDNQQYDFWYNPPYHKEGLNVLHLNGRAHFVKGKKLEELFDEEVSTNPQMYWVNRFNVLDNM